MFVQLQILTFFYRVRHISTTPFIYVRAKAPQQRMETLCLCFDYHFEFCAEVKYRGLILSSSGFSAGN
jgi:hypothetical protein